MLVSTHTHKECFVGDLRSIRFDLIRVVNKNYLQIFTRPKLKSNAIIIKWSAITTRPIKLWVFFFKSIHSSIRYLTDWNPSWICKWRTIRVWESDKHKYTMNINTLTQIHSHSVHCKTTYRKILKRGEQQQPKMYIQ